MKLLISFLVFNFVIIYQQQNKSVFICDYPQKRSEIFHIGFIIVIDNKIESTQWFEVRTDDKKISVTKHYPLKQFVGEIDKNFVINAEGNLVSTENDEVIGYKNPRLSKSKYEKIGEKFLQSDNVKRLKIMDSLSLNNLLLN